MAYFIGVMSGTSLDGVDVAIVNLAADESFQFIAAQTFPFAKPLYAQLHQLISNQIGSLQQLGEVDTALGRLIGQSINALLAEHKLSANDISAIGSHGQTLFHSPEGEQPFSLQIGNASIIAEITGITTVADFRQRDIAAGGQGAPLVPAFHQALFNSTDEGRVIVNIGGISNITVLPNDSSAVTGFDTGPGNVLLDHWTKLHLGKPYDQGGEWAKSGQCNQDLLTLLLDEAYFSRSIPKSTGRELFNQIWLDNKLEQYTDKLSLADVQATLTELTAHTIAQDISRYANSCTTVFICGGGAHNDYLLTRLACLLSNNDNTKHVHTTDSIELNPDWVEACAFAWLAYRSINHLSGNLAAVTGAKHSVVLGAVYPAKLS
ncbi:MAG: anhydro-N-acetylmuramic acid kinase [Gammaproteobacteria bacterium]|nr:MAG: anhydro-N-acetylmuramic acid kinase [Gammaproteobacteria bacterium]